MSIYVDDYKQFINNIETGVPVTALDTGKLISRMAQHFSDAVMECAKAEQAYNKKLVEFEKGNDDNGKSLSSAKAENFAKATDEYYLYTVSEGSVKSIEQMINA